MNTLVVDDSNDRLAAIAQLLHHASLQVWEQADRAPSGSPLQGFGLGVYLARSQAADLVPAGHPEPDLDLEGRTVLQLLTEAEHLTRPLPAERVDLAGSVLVVELCDLAREARDLGY